MPRYKITLSFDVDRVTDYEDAERIAAAAAKRLASDFSYFVVPKGNGATITAHNITNVESPRPGIITNHDDPIYSD